MTFEGDPNEQLSLEEGEKEESLKQTYQWIEMTDYQSSSLLVTSDLKDRLTPEEAKISDGDDWHSYYSHVNCVLLVIGVSPH